MNLRWMQAPCKDCPDRHILCHSTCEKYKEYKEKYYAEKYRLYLEDKTKNQINQINYDSASKDRKNKGALKHGYKPKRR